MKLPTRGGILRLDRTEIEILRINRKQFQFIRTVDHTGDVLVTAQEWDGYGRWIPRHSWRGNKGG